VIKIKPTLTNWWLGADELTQISFIGSNVNNDRTLTNRPTVGR